MISPAAAALLAAAGAVSAAAMCLALRASHRTDRRMHAETVRDAMTGMFGALSAESPQNALLRKLSALLAEQDGKAVALEARMRELFPGPARANPDCLVERLAALTDLTWDLCQKEAAVPEIEARVMEMLAEEEPHAVVSSFVAGNFDFSRDTLARAQFIMAGDHTERAADSLVLSSALALYTSDVETAAIDMCVAQPDHQNGHGRPRAARSAKQLAAHVFRSGISNLPDAAAETNPGSPRPADGPASQRRAARGGQPACSPVQLRVQDVFDLAPRSSWMASGRAYLPLFGFVVSDLHDLVALDDEWAALLAAVRELPEDSPTARRSPEDSAHQPGGSVAARQGGRRPSLPPDIDGPPGDVVRALIGPKVTGIVDGRRLAWSMSECNTELVALLAGADDATLRLFAEVADGLEAEFETYLATMGHVPRLDTIGRGRLAQIASDLEEAGRRHVRLAHALIAEAEALGQLSPAPGVKPDTTGDTATQSPDTGRLLAAVAAADMAITASREALAGGAFLKAACDVLSARIPMSPSGLPGHGLYGDFLAQVRPLAILASAHRIAVADWAALALQAYFRSCQAAAAMITNRLDAYQHEHEQIIIAANASVARLQRAGNR